MRTGRTALLIAAFVTAFAIDAHAWSEAGHKIVAAIAFRQLSPRAQQKLGALLKHHPRYEEDFVRHMPAEVASGPAEMQNEWLLQQAAIWPDMARGLPDELKDKFNHPTWHYIDIPTFLSESDRTALEKDLKLNMSVELPATAQPEMNAVQAIHLARKTLAAHAADEAEAAVWLCWLLHTIGDLHQPLHSTAMFSVGLFPEGDKGGNSVPTQQGFNLHALWDEFLGDWATFATAQERAKALLADGQAAQSGRAARQQLDETVWLAESRGLAQSAVYSPEVIGYLRVQKPTTDRRGPPPLRLSEEYLTTGVRISTERVVQAGYRLGAVLESVTTDEVAGAR